MVLVGSRPERPCTPATVGGGAGDTENHKDQVAAL